MFVAQFQLEGRSVRKTVDHVIMYGQMDDRGHNYQNISKLTGSCVNG